MPLKSKSAELTEMLNSARLIREKSISAKSFKEQQAKNGAYDFKDRGFKMVPLEQITGSVGRYHEFDRKFRPDRKTPPARLLSIRKAMRAGKYLPPVQLYQIKDEFYVLDGNHRVAAANEFGFKEIEAQITEFLPSKDTLENIIYIEKSEFQEKTGLTQAVKLTEMGQYAYLLRQISEHREHLQQVAKTPVSLKDASLDWYETIYLPLTEIVRRTNLLDHFPNRTAADFFVYISYQHWEKGRKRNYGCGLNQLIPEEMEEFRNKMANKEESNYPDMVREISAFVLVKIDTKRDHHVVDKLFSLKEIKDVHLVIGNVDIIAKIVLQRDLLSSDAVTIGEFIQNQVRPIPGVVSTETLIPGYSKTKP
jgi:hypothetical protein